MRGMDKTLHIIGGGLAGSEAAWQAANLGVNVVIHEMRPKVETFAHKSGDLAEMVCSNSFRSDDHEQNAVGLLHWEMRQAGGLIMEMAGEHRLPAGGALAVDREAFAAGVTEKINNHNLITVDYEEITELPSSGHWIIATGPLTSSHLGEVHRRGDRPRRFSLLRCDRPDHLRRQHRHEQSLDAIALRQRRNRGRAHSLPQLPNGQRAIRRVH